MSKRSDFLAASGYTVIDAVDGAESVAKAASEHPDLVQRGKSRRCPVLQQSRSLP
jgi:hypothetical protein